MRWRPASPRVASGAAWPSTQRRKELAKRAKVARSYVALIEAGHKKNPSLEILKRLARALGVPVGELLE
jgi:transcriptional regulator with XRE-family HTH domain